jgi:hypothetical protein
MFSYKLDILNKGLIHKYCVINNTEPMSYANALDLWQHNESFRSFFNSLLANAPFSAYRWETPPVSIKTVNRKFEFILLDSPSLVRPPDTKIFASYFTTAESGTGIVVFENLGKDALLVVPCPQGSNSAYAHIAAFTRNAPDPQIHALWQIVGRTMQQRITNEPVWLSTEGHGVSWLHIRLDSRPKYYGFTPYKAFI